MRLTAVASLQHDWLQVFLQYMMMMITIMIMMMITSDDNDGDDDDDDDVDIHRGKKKSQWCSQPKNFVTGSQGGDGNGVVR